MNEDEKMGRLISLPSPEGAERLRQAMRTELRAALGDLLRSLSDLQLSLAKMEKVNRAQTDALRAELRGLK